MAVIFPAFWGGRYLPPPPPPRKIPGTHSCWRQSRPQGHSAAGRISSIKKSHDIVNGTRDLGRLHIPEDNNLHNHRYKNFKSALKDNFKSWVLVRWNTECKLSKVRNLHVMWYHTSDWWFHVNLSATCLRLLPSRNERMNVHLTHLHQSWHWACVRGEGYT
jgi:hypothetical protein